MRRSIAIQNPARLSLKRTMLRIENESGDHSVPLEEIDVLVLDHDAIHISEPLLGQLGEARVALVVCNSKHIPAAMMLPFEGHTLTSQTLRGQILASKPSQKRIWQTIIREKIRSQARLLLEKRGGTFGLERFAASVFSGDTTNREGVAAGVYFSELFGPGFTRIRSKNSPPNSGGNDDEYAPDEPTFELDTFRITNAMLNYGYAIVRAAVARAVVLSGLHPALGVHHRHRENTFSLADDLMEPLRVLVDRIVFDIVQAEADLPEELTPELKRRLLSVLTSEVMWKGSRWPLDAALEAYAAGVRSCLLGETTVLEVPGA